MFCLHQTHNLCSLLLPNKLVFGKRGCKHKEAGVIGKNGMIKFLVSKALFPNIEKEKTHLDKW